MSLKVKLITDSVINFCRWSWYIVVIEYNELVLLKGRDIS